MPKLVKAHFKIISAWLTFNFKAVFVAVLLSFAILISPLKAIAQNSLEFEGHTTTRSGRNLEGALIGIYKNSEKDIEIRSGKNGVFKLSLKLGEDYKLTFSYPGYADMYLTVVTSNLPESKLYTVMPLYQTPIYFYEKADTTINFSQFTNPINKVIFDGNLAFKDDDGYFNYFNRVLRDPELRKRDRLEKLRKEQELRENVEKERLDAEKEYLTKLKIKEAQTKAAAEAARIKAEAEARAEADRRAMEELEKLKAEASKKPQEDNTESKTEMAAILLQETKEAKNIVERKNKSIKSEYETGLLEMIAENEKKTKSSEYRKMKSQAESNSVIETIRNVTELNAKAEYIRDKEKGKSLKRLVNKQIKIQQINKLALASAFTDRSTKIYNQKRLPEAKDYSLPPSPMLNVKIEEGFFQTTSLITVRLGRNLDIFKKQTYSWGAKYYYKNNEEISEMNFKKEMKNFLNN